MRRDIPIEGTTAFIIGTIVPLLIFKAGALAIGFGLALIGTLIVSWRDGRRWGGRSPWMMAFIGMIALWGVSALGSLEPWNSLARVGRLFFYVAAAGWLWFWLGQDHERRRRAIIGLLVTGSLLPLYHVIVFDLTIRGGVGGQPLDPWQIDQLIFHGAFGLMPMTKFSSVAACLIPALVGGAAVLARQEGSKGWWGVAALGSLANLLLILQSHTLAPILGLICAIPAGLWIACSTMPARIRQLARTGIAGVMIGIGLTVFLQIPDLPDSHFPGFSFSIPDVVIDYHRQKIWAVTWHKFLDAPWFGHGPRMIRHVPIEPEYSWITTSISNYHPHNVLGEILAETGIIGFSAMLITLYLAWRQGPHPTGAVILGAVWWGSAMVNFSFWNSWWQLTFLLLLLLLVEPAADRRARGSGLEGRRGRAGGVRISG